MRSTLLGVGHCLLLMGTSTVFAQQGASPEVCEQREVLVRIRRLEITGSNQRPQQAIARLRDKLAAEPQCIPNEDLGRIPHLPERIRDLWQQHGYFQATVWPVRMEWEKTSTGFEVDATFGVDDGQQYRLKHISWSGVSVFPESQLTDLFPITPGAIFNVELIRTGLERVAELYTEHGYLQFVPVPDTELDAADSITLLISVEEGHRFRFGHLETFGIDAALRARIVGAWLRYQGSFYSRSELERFFEGFEKAAGERLHRFQREDSGPAEVHFCIDQREAIEDPPCFAGVHFSDRELPVLRRTD